MEQLSKIFPIFVPSLSEMGGGHRGEQLCFDQSVNLENSL